MTRNETVSDRDVAFVCGWCDLPLDPRSSDEFLFHTTVRHTASDLVMQTAGRLPKEEARGVELEPLSVVEDKRRVFFSSGQGEGRITGWGTLVWLGAKRWKVEFDGGGSVELRTPGIRRWCKVPVVDSERRVV